MNAIGLIAAMSMESQALLRQVHDIKWITSGELRCATFEHSRWSCYLVTSGMGARRAYKTARALMAAFAPRCIVSFGIAGAVQADLEIGDVVAIDAVRRMDQGSISPALALTPWTNRAIQHMTKELAGGCAHLFNGTAITTQGTQVGAGDIIDIAHPVLEMETMGIAQASAEGGIPLLALRAISDGPRAPIPFDLGRMMDDDANLRLGALLVEIMRHPGIMPQLVRMRRNSQVACNQAAMSLLAGLSHLNL